MKFTKKIIVSIIVSLSVVSAQSSAVTLSNFNIEVETKKTFRAEVKEWAAGSSVTKGYDAFSAACVDLRPLKNLFIQETGRQPKKHEVVIAVITLPTPEPISHNDKIENILITTERSTEPYFLTGIRSSGNNTFTFTNEQAYFFKEIAEILSSSKEATIEISIERTEVEFDEKFRNIGESKDYLTHKYKIDLTKLREPIKEIINRCEL